MKALRSGLCVGLLFLACVLGLQVSFLLRESAARLDEVASASSHVLSSAGSTLDLAQSTLAIQQGYYRDSASHIKALTKAAAIDAIQLGRLIEQSRRAVENTDAR